MVLADLGARVIKVEHPGKGDDTRHWGPPFLGKESAYFLSINRNKESVTVDFKPAEGRDVLERLIARADVFVENFRPGTIERAGFGWDAVHHASSAAGLRVDLRLRTDRTAQRRSRLRRGDAGRRRIDERHRRSGSARLSPRRRDHRHGRGPVLRAGHHGGAARARAIGHGQRVDIGMLDTTAALLTYQAANWFATGKIPQRQGNRHATIAPYETFTTKDGEIVIAVGNDAIWQKFCPAIGLPELAADPRFTTNKDRMENYDAMRPPIDRAFRTKTYARMDRDPECGRRRQRRGARHRPDAERSAARRPRDGADADAPHRRRHQGDRRADQAVGERSERPHAAAGAWTAHRRSARRDRL